MRSKLTLNDKKRTHFKIFPLIENYNIKEEDCEKLYQRLNTDEAVRKFIYSNKHKGFKICVFELDDITVISQCIVNEFKTQNCIIYITKKEELSDAINIAKFLQSNAETIMSDYKNQILEARDDLLIKKASNKQNIEA